MTQKTILDIEFCHKDEVNPRGRLIAIKRGSVSKKQLIDALWRATEKALGKELVIKGL
jgi:hypothetical protein